MHSRGVIQPGYEATNHQVVKLARDSDRSPPSLIFRVWSGDFDLDSTNLGKRILIREYLGLGPSLWLW